MSQRGAYGEQLRSMFHVKNAPAFVTQALRKTEIAATYIRCDIENNGLTAPIPREDAFLITLHVRDCPVHDMWIDGRPIETGYLAAGTTCIYDLRRSPICNSVSPFESVHFYLPRAALNAIADIESGPRVDDIDHNPGMGIDDPVTRGLGLALLPAFKRANEVNTLFVDHVTIATAAHFMRAYGGQAARRPPGDRLAAWQEARIKEILSAHLDGNLSVSSLAKECGLPVTRFVNAFRRSTGVSPHRWLLQRRVDKALDLLQQSDWTVAEVATVSGFADEAHLRRALWRMTGSVPEAIQQRLRPASPWNS
jgi:AraC family transcriptional regulator